MLEYGKSGIYNNNRLPAEKKKKEEEENTRDRSVPNGSDNKQMRMFVEHFDSRFGMSARPLCPHWLPVSLSHLKSGPKMAGCCCQKKKLHDIKIGLFIGCRTWKQF